MSLSRDWLIEEYERNNCKSQNHAVMSEEINDVLEAIGAPRIAVNNSAPDKNDGSQLWNMTYYMILKLAKRISELEKKLEAKK